MASISAIDRKSRYIVLWDKLGKNPFLSPFFQSLSFLYGFSVYLRKKSYAKGLISVKRLACPVVSVGNITVGGTGKTPIVGMIAKFLLDHGRHPVILTRGYKRRGGKNIKIISDTEKILATPEESGDEPYMLARWLPGIPIIVGKNRYASAMFALKKFIVDCFILDDGFQHIRLFRDMDILVINARDPFSNGRLLPWGHLREPLCSINRASLFLLNKSIPGQNLDCISSVIRKYNTKAPIIETTYTPVCFVSASNEKLFISISTLKGKSVLAFSGIADPSSFFEFLKEIGVIIVKSLIFSDHHWFSEKDLDKIGRIANSSAAEYIITTEKDGVRLPPWCRDNIYILKMKMGFGKSQQILESIMGPILVL